MKNTKTTLATAPKIELKNVKTFRGMEGHGLNATIYIDGIKTAFIMDAADGGEPQYDVFNKEKFKQVEDYAASLPKMPLDFGNGAIYPPATADTKHGEIIEFGKTPSAENEEPLMFQPDISFLIDEVFNKLERAKQAKKLEKKMVQSVMWGVPGGENYIEQKFRIPLSEIPAYKLQAYLDKYMSEFKAGEEFLNNNLNILGLITNRPNPDKVLNLGTWSFSKMGDVWAVLRYNEMKDEAGGTALVSQIQGEYPNEMTAKIVLAKVQGAAAKMAAVVA